MSFNGVAVKFYLSEHRVVVVVKKEITSASLINTHDFQSTDHPLIASEIIQDINDFSCSNPIKRFNTHISHITSVDFNLTDDTFITASWDQTVRLGKVDEENGKLVYTHLDCVSSIKWNPDEKSRHASASFDGILRLWDVNGNTATQTIHADDSPIMSLNYKVCLVKFSRHKVYQITSCSYDGKIVLWDYGLGDHDSKMIMYDDYKGVVQGLNMSRIEDGLLASIGSDGLVRIWIHIPSDM
ncbi:peroxisome biogenesis protein 7-like [Magnolia sinica]|uniref:peroxisome biogenesis protein 7-like n=1 Tax=Magnolia sinica TaxID=86752 RepID=UPI00265AC38E|nr:peroxisome biogenesis protein 7-like [Magnolia sinica]